MIKQYRKLKKIRKKKIWWRQRSFWVAASCAATFLAVAGTIAFAPFFQIRSIQIEGMTGEAASPVQTRIQELLTRHVAFWQSRSIALVSLGNAKEIILKEFPEIADMSLRRTLSRDVLATIRERSGAASWCSKQARQCYTLDKEGIPFRAADPGTQLVLSEDPETTPVVLGAPIISSDLLVSLFQIKDGIERATSLRQESLFVNSFTIVEQRNLHAATSEGWQVYLDPMEDIQWQITKLGTILEKKIPAGKRGSLEYIDVRFGDQGYVKYKGVTASPSF